GVDGRSGRVFLQPRRDHRPPHAGGPRQPRLRPPAPRHVRRRPRRARAAARRDGPGHPSARRLHPRHRRGGGLPRAPPRVRARLAQGPDDAPHAPLERGGRVFRNREDFRYLTWRDALLPPPAADGARLRPPPPPRHDISATFDRRLTPFRSPRCSRSPCPRSPSTSTSAWPTWRRRRDLAVAAPASACQGAGGRSGVKWDMRAALLCLGLLGCTHPCPEYRLPPGPTHTFLWEATGPATLYLYGTYHVASRDEVPDAAWSRLAASKAIILELPE